ncbi:DUF1810 domain-containing protein [Thiomicrorhabdus sp. zzn3]|uniref:DUF1810 domain-containing protein n=1 Tax=Thiomicrorhabdus sp. zzn3 TaxID=3039775 RepID=UPI0024369E3B|nr:DUF1810 domain-containing protein [Thiomicrorhabdus sp. zzn3]MDG6777898.1 DUF1810 domain-containing protein [Thiomicrorhabdus sp. zzn3]
MKTYHLERFVQAQENIYATALSELKAGRKRSHWMWFVFPQIDGLGHSETTRFYSIKSLKEAQAYLNHPLLGPRLLECTQAVLAHPDSTLMEIFGKPDNKKFCACMTLFESVAENKTLFNSAIQQFCNAERSQKTMDILHPLS